MQTYQTKTMVLVGLVVILGVLCGPVLCATPAGSAFTYQGYLSDAAAPADGMYDFEFKLSSDAYTVVQVESTRVAEDVEVDEGKFAVELDFGGAAFNGDARWLQIAIRPYDSTEPLDFVTLSPMQELTPAPYAVYAASTGGVSWSDMTDVPSGFADGIDSDALGNLSCGYGYLVKSDGEGGWSCALPDAVLWQTAGSDIYYNGGNVGIGMDSPTHRLTVESPSEWALRLIGPDGTYGYGGRLNFGDGDYAYIEEDEDDRLLLRSDRTTITGGYVGIGTTVPEQRLHVAGSACVDGNVGIGVTSPQERLHVSGVSRFDLGSGQINMSTPGGWPGAIVFSPNGNRRDIVFDNGGLYIAASDSSSSPPASKGISISENGNVGIGVYYPSLKLDVAGTTRTRILQITGGSDLSEQFDVTSRQGEIKPGMVVCIDAESPGKLVVSSSSYDRTVAGILSGAGGVTPGMLMTQTGSTADGASPVALTGRVYCWTDASAGSVRPGDLLTTSDIPGHAMKVSDYRRAQGAILGKAMSSLESGKGLVLVLVTLQ